MSDDYTPPGTILGWKDPSNYADFPSWKVYKGGRVRFDYREYFALKAALDQGQEIPESGGGVLGDKL